MLTQCRICGDSGAREKFSARGHTIMECPKCGYAQLGSKPAAEETASIYNKDYYRENKYGDTGTLDKEHARRFNLIRKYVSAESTKILDFGCASGEFIDYIGGRYDMWGIEISNIAVKEAQRRMPGIHHRLVCGDSAAGRFGLGFFDAVVMWDVIEHLWDPCRVLGQVLGLIRPGGFLFLSTPDFGSELAKLMGRNWMFMTPPEHVGFFSRSSARHLLETKFNCEVLESFSRGKWVNAGFALYKLRRIFPWLVPMFMLNAFKLKWTKSLAFYAPTFDILYLAVKKPDSIVDGLSEQGRER